MQIWFEGKEGSRIKKINERTLICKPENLAFRRRNHHLQRDGFIFSILLSLHLTPNQ